MNYQEIIQKNIKEFDDVYVKCSDAYENNYDGLKIFLKSEDNTLFETYPYPENAFELVPDKVKQWHTQSLISYLEEENKRLEESKYDDWDGADNIDVGFNRAINEQVEHNKNVIAYLKQI